MNDSICIESSNIASAEFKDVLKTIEAADCTWKRLCVVTELTKNNSKLLENALKKNTSITEIDLQHYLPCNCDLSFLKILNKQSRITSLAITTTQWYPDLGSYLKINKSLKSLSLNFMDTLDSKEKDLFSEELIPAIENIGTLEVFSLECRKLTRWDLNGFVDVLNGNKNLRKISIDLTHCAMNNVNNAAQALAAMPNLTSFGLIANGSNSLDGIPLLEALKGNKNIKSIEFHENWLNDKPDLVQILSGLSSLESLTMQPGDTRFSADISPLFVASSPIRLMEFNPVNFMNDNLAKVLPEAPLRLVKFHIQWNKYDRVPAVTNFCKAAWSNYTLEIEQKYNDRCGPDPAKIAIIKASMHRQSLMSLSKVFFILQCILLPAENGFFQNLPQELLIPIFLPVVFLSVDYYFVQVKELTRLIEFAKRREYIQAKDRRTVMKEIWLALEWNERQ